jgi:DNA-binding beta-propeller fold protein YncE
MPVIICLYTTGTLALNSTYNTFMKQVLCIAAVLALLTACTKEKYSDRPLEETRSLAKKEVPMFAEIGSIDIGGLGAAEISAFDAATKKLFVVNNSDGNNKIDVLDLSNPATPVYLTSISMLPYGGLVNSVSVSNGKLAAAIESLIKTNNGKVLVFNTSDYSVVAQVEAGALPDMVTFSPDGLYILSANEGEPNADYSIDPIGSISIISVMNGYAVTTLNFESFAGQETALKAKGFRIFGKNASFAQDIEPEYIAVSANSKTAWVTLQENNAIAKIDIEAKAITDIFPLGFKDYNKPENAIDPSDRDGGIMFNPWPVKGIYMPDGIAVYSDNNVPYVFTANEGDAREYNGFVEMSRVKDITLDPTSFTNATDLRKDAQLGRLNITTTLGDPDQDGKFNELYSLGGRSFSIWNGNTGALVFDSKNELDIIGKEMSAYDDGRSDDKAVEPEGIVMGKVGNRNLLFVGMERADAVAVYDVSNPNKPIFLQWLATGDAPEGVHFVPASESPNGQSLLIVSSENDGQVKIFATASN